MTERGSANRWHEDILYAALGMAIAITLLFNGFTALTDLFVVDGEIKGGPTGKKGLVAFFSLLEKGWWKYLIVAGFAIFSLTFLRSGIRKIKSK